MSDYYKSLFLHISANHKIADKEIVGCKATTLNTE